MTRLLTLAILVLTLASCGVQRPLIRPSEIPAFEEKQRKKHERIEQEKREALENDAQKTPTEPAQ